MAGLADQPVRIGVSACVTGQEVLCDEARKPYRFVRDTLGRLLHLVQVCPQMEMDLGVPPESLRLVQLGRGVRLISQSGVDRTTEMTDYARKRCNDLAGENLCGFIVQEGSAACGMERVKVHRHVGTAQPRGRGLFTAALMERMPHLPVEESGRLDDPAPRENFVERVFAYRRLRILFSRRWRIGDLLDLHRREELLILSHDRPSYEQLGRLMASAKNRSKKELAAEYQRVMLAALERVATRPKQTSILWHVSGFLGRLLDVADRRELSETVESYRRGMAPLIVPVTLLRHHVRRHGLKYLAEQTYLHPHPHELLLRNHV
jgi:uncharacterized protein YbgA (DUF1722 family)/uncharacterized protein YbbK (DUF523 family)